MYIIIDQVLYFTYNRKRNCPFERFLKVPTYNILSRDIKY